MSDRKGFLILPSWSDAFCAFSRSRSTGDILTIINDYCTTGQDPVLPEKGEVTVAWILIKPLIDSYNKDIENGKKGGAPTGNQNAIKTTPLVSENNPPTPKKTTPLVLKNNIKTTPLVLKNNPPTPKKTTKREREKEKEINNIPPIVPQGGVVSAGFEKFWQAYPKKVAKQDAIRAFGRAKKVWTQQGKDITYILGAVTRAVNSDQWRRDNGKYIPYPASWLNQGRWDDEQITELETREEEYKPVSPMTECRVCHSKNVETRGIYSKCFDCEKNYTWTKNDWREEND